MNTIFTVLAPLADNGMRAPTPTIDLNGYSVHPVIFNQMLSDTERGRALLASIAMSQASGIGCDTAPSTEVGRAVQRRFTAADRLLDAMCEGVQQRSVAQAIINECCVLIFG